MKKVQKRVRRGQRGQALIEYVILIAVVALTSLFVLGMFSDRLREMITGITVTLGGEEDSTADKKSIDIIQELDQTGVQ